MNFASEPADLIPGADLDAELADVFGLSVPAPTPTPEPTPAPPPAEAAGGDPAPSAPPPVEPTPAPEPSSTPPPAAAPLPGLEQTPSPAPAPAQPAPAVPTADETALRMASLQAQNEALQAELARSKQAPAPGTTPAPTPADPAAEEPTYGLTVPDQVAAAIFNEDPNIAKAGINHMINSLAVIIHKKVRAEYQEAITSFRGELSGATMEQQRHAEASRMQNEYYEAFPQHKVPVLGPIITQVASAMAAEFPHAPWDKNYIAALGQRVNAKLGELGVPAQPVPAVPTPAPTPAPSPKPAAFVPTAPRHPLERNSEEVTPDAVVDLFRDHDG